jgi:pilus assembly protein CpaB
MLKRLQTDMGRVIVSIALIIISAIIIFIGIPIIQGSVAGIHEVVFAKKEIKKGEKISADDVIIKKVSVKNLPQNLPSKETEVVGKYSKQDVGVGIFFQNNQLTTEPLFGGEYLSKLDGTKVAKTIELPSEASSLAGEIRPGDIISIYSLLGDTASLPRELRYMFVLSVAGGLEENQNSLMDTDSSAKDLSATTITLLCSEVQATTLAMLSSSKKLDCALVYRGNDETTQKFIDAQDNMINGNRSNTTSSGISEVEE